MTIFGLSRRVHSFCLEPMSRKDTTPVFYCFQKVQPKYKNSIPLHPGEAYSSKGLIFVRYVVKPTSSGKKYFLHSLRKNSRLFAFFVISSTCVFHFGGGGHGPIGPFLDPPLAPSKASGRKLWAHISFTIFPSDDVMETLSETEMRKICDAFVMMDEQICKQCPHFPTIAKMKFEYLEVASGMLGTLSGENLSLINELYCINAFNCLTLNNVYSHEKEERRGITGVNTVSTMSESEECSSVDTDAALKAIRILDALVKVQMYQMIQNSKQGNPDNKELHKLLDYVGMATAGWYFHEYSPRYQDVQLRMTLVDVEEGGLKE